MAQSIAEFRIIGRIGKIDSKEKVTFNDVASNHNRQRDGEWDVADGLEQTPVVEPVHPLQRGIRSATVPCDGPCRASRLQSGRLPA